LENVRGYKYDTSHLVYYGPWTKIFPFLEVNCLGKSKWVIDGTYIMRDILKSGKMSGLYMQSSYPVLVFIVHCI
jgi:hypothetical protein